jgi:DNA-binding GntR family transcriptional regulator
MAWAVLLQEEIPKKMSTTAEHAYRSLRKMVVKGELSAGQRVSQVRIARQLGCSTVPVVEALRRLESEGVLVKEPRKMARVRVLDPDELEGLYLARQALEMVAAKLCAKRIKEEEIEPLKQLVARLEVAAEKRDFAECDHLDMELHHYIVRCANCPLVEQELSRLMLIERTIPSPYPESFDCGRYYASHNAIVHAIAHHDADSAEYLMKKHIEVGYEESLGSAHEPLDPTRN